MIMRLLFLFSCCAVICCSHSSYTMDQPAQPGSPPPPPPGPYQMVWSDEFDHAGLPDSSKWSYDVGGNGWGNNELEYYTSKRMENARVENGNLVIEARKESWQGMNYTSARLLTKGKMSWQYGKIETRAKLPRGRGTWPAIWMLGDTNPLKWPDDGEVDIMEHVGFDQGIIHGSVHCKKYNWVIGNGKTATTPVMDCSDSFHVYTVEWDNNNLKISVDSMSYMSFSNEHSGYDAWPFDNKLFMILNIAVGGNWGGQKGVDDSIWPQQMLVDYVRVYQRK